ELFKIANVPQSTEVEMLLNQCFANVPQVVRTLHSNVVEPTKGGVLDASVHVCRNKRGNGILAMFLKVRARLQRNEAESSKSCDDLFRELLIRIGNSPSRVCLESFQLAREDRIEAHFRRKEHRHCACGYT